MRQEYSSWRYYRRRSSFPHRKQVIHSLIDILKSTPFFEIILFDVSGFPCLINSKTNQSILVIYR